MLDLSKIAGKKVAVHVPTVEKAKQFIEEMERCYPHKIGYEPVPTYSINMYENYGYNGFCYYPRFHENRKMTFGDRGTYDDWGIPVVEFEDLLAIELTTNVSDVPIESLFD